MMERMLGSTSCQMIQAGPAPSERAACTCSRARMPRATPQATRANCGAYRMPMVATSVGRLPPIKASTTNATKISGRDTNTSTTRMAAAPARRPRKATPTPMATPSTPASATAAAATVSDTRAPCTARDSRSRPSSSVPSQCFQVGEDSRLAASIWYGSCRPSMGTEGGGQRHQQQEGRRQPGRQRGGQKRGGRRTAASTETDGRSCRRPADAGIDQPLGQVDGQADQDEDGEDGQQAALDDG